MAPVPRIQFLAIEIARNREGYNSDIRRLYGKSSNAAAADASAAAAEST